MRYVSILFISWMMFSCSADLFELANRNNLVPITTRPEAQCFIEENEITISWGKDDAADEYYLYRDIAPDGLFLTLCYNGTGMQFKDTSLNADMRYYYKLAKRREEKMFPKSPCILGVSHPIRRDKYEDNNTRETATQFIDVIDANIYYYQDNEGNKLEDVDWYWMNLEPRRYVILKIWSPDENSNILPNQLYFSEDGGGLVPIDAEEITYGTKLYNYDYVQVKRYFRISVQPANFIEDTQEGGKIGTYQIKFVSSQNVEPS